MLIYNAVLHPMDQPIIPNGYVQLRDGKITAVGPMEQCPADTERLDAHGGHLLPGLIDAHCHLGIFGESLGEEGADGNEITDPWTPQLRAIDGINPLDRYFAEARAAGVTTVAVAPGSANAIGGQIAVLKTQGRVIDEMVLQAPAAMKLALGENPKRVYRCREETPQTRMATAAVIREALGKAREYWNKKRRAETDAEEDAPNFDAKLEALGPLLEGKIPAHIHAHRADDMATAIRIANEFHLNYVLIHGTEGYLIADYVAKQNVPVVTGPLLTDRSKPELSNQSLKNPALLTQAGVHTAICTDHPEIPIPYLMLSAAMAAKAGMDEEEALRAVTLTPAELLGLADRLGSLTPGKDGDLVLYDRPPLELAAKVTAVYINGEAIQP
ncbi:MAG: amidohydrolase [Oscillospiraceae bacterium]|nr:amidohydrolase [Oscillospiraceae bacterium]